jgi:hypothetical protein
MHAAICAPQYRCEPNDNTIISPRSESGLLEAKLSWQQAAQYLQDQPHAVSSKIINHFNKIFEVKSIEGTLPKMNEMCVILFPFSCLLSLFP